MFLKKKKKNDLKGIIYLLITAIIWGGSFISQLLGGQCIGSFFFIVYRCLFGCMIIAIMIFYDNWKNYKKIIFFSKNEKPMSTIVNSSWCGFVLFLSMITQQVGVEMTTIAKSGLIASLEVVFVPIILVIFYGKRIKYIVWVFIITSMLGVMLLSMNSISGICFGDFLVLISSILYSVTIIQVTKYIKIVDPLKLSFFRFVVVGLFSFILALVFESKDTTFESFKMALPSILYSGILSSGIAYTLQIIGQKYCDAVIATLIVSLEGVFAAIFGWILLNQTLNFIQIVGCIIAIISIMFVEILDN